MWNRKRNQIELALRVAGGGEAAVAARRAGGDTITVRVHETEVAPAPPRHGQNGQRGIKRSNVITEWPNSQNATKWSIPEQKKSLGH